MIIASDCVVWPELILPLFESIRHLAAHSSSLSVHHPTRVSRVVLSFEERKSEVTALLKQTLPQNVYHVPKLMMDSDYTCDEIHVFEWNM